tara:strand:+ start:510 stop:1040 length:531 start_codon:yes stop_codon:yes gene_type:complete
MKTITKEYTVYDIEDLKKDDELCDKIYQKFWIDNADNINTLADENLDSFKKFADTLNMGIDYSLSNGEYSDRGCYIKLDTSDYHYISPNNRSEHISLLLKDYTGNGYCFCVDLKVYADKLISEWHKDYSIDDFAQDIQNRMFEMWFADNRDYFLKETFLNYVEINKYEFDENGNLF